MFLTKDTTHEKYPIYHHPEMKGVRRRELLTPNNASKNFALRAYIIEPGGYTSYDIHSHEHGVYMISGEAVVKVGDEMLSLHPGDVIYISSNEPHQFFNRGEVPVKFLCVRNFTSSL